MERKKYYFRTQKEKQKDVRTLNIISELFPDIELLDIPVSILGIHMRDIPSGSQVYIDDFFDFKAEYDSIDEIKQFYREAFYTRNEVIFIKTPQFNMSHFVNMIQLFCGLCTVHEFDEYIGSLLKLEIDYFTKSNELRKDIKSTSMHIAKEKGSSIGLKKGTVLTIPKANKAKEDILKNAKSFGGKMKDKDVMEEFSIPRTSYYKYKKELKAEKK